MIEKIQYSLDDLERVACTIIQLMDTQKVFIFKGDVGSGKTTLIKAILKNLGYLDAVSSPTYSIVNTYIIDDKGIIVNHFDLYRVKNQIDLYDVGLVEYLHGNQFCFIEWPDIAIDLIEDGYIEIQINNLNFDSQNTERELTITTFQQ
jgi:tRNA threonylcarbamoyladenosine biosynthesis protein TsaE